MSSESLEFKTVEEPEKIISEKNPEELADKELNVSVEIAEKTSQEIAKEEKLNLVSVLEATDLKHPALSKGYEDYWKKRLIPELDLLPRDVQEAVLGLIQGKSFSGKPHSVLNNYINKRLSLLEFSLEKRRVMARLENRLQKIDRKENYVGRESEGRRTVFYDESAGGLFIERGEERNPIGYGDIVADYDWGIRYQPDKSVPEKIWRRLRKLADLTEARLEVEKIFNQEIAQIETIPLPTTSLSEERLEGLSGEQKNRFLVLGAVAEKMARNFLLRVQYNNPELGLRVESSNALEDAELKYDFKVSIPKKRRGVALEGDDISRKEVIENKKKLGVQFTAGSGGGKLTQIKEAKKHIRESKYSQFIKKPVDDIILVKLRFGTYMDYFQKWLTADKPSGGPEQYMTKKEKAQLFRAVTKNFLNLSDVEIEKAIA